MFYNIWLKCLVKILEYNLISDNKVCLFYLNYTFINSYGYLFYMFVRHDLLIELFDILF